MMIQHGIRVTDAMAILLKPEELYFTWPPSRHFFERFALIVNSDYAIHDNGELQQEEQDHHHWSYPGEKWSILLRV